MFRFSSRNLIGVYSNNKTLLLDFNSHFPQARRSNICKNILILQRIFKTPKKIVSKTIKDKMLSADRRAQSKDN